MVWGVTPLLVLNLTSTTETIPSLDQYCPRAGTSGRRGSGGDHSGDPAGGSRASTDLIKIEIVTAVMGQGMGIGQGSVSGCARVAHTSTGLKDFNRGEILVAPRTEATYVEAMRKAAGIITEDGNVDSHAAVLGLRLGIPCDCRGAQCH